MLLEVIAESVEDAREAEQGGAGRIELVRELDRGGLTPPLDLIEAVTRAVRIPVRVMLRDSEPFELADPAEPGRLHAVAQAAHDCGAAGFVAGFLRNGSPSLTAIYDLLRSLDGPLTFHRAFEAARDLIDAVATLAAEPRVDRILTSGGDGPWKTRFARLKALRNAAPPRLGILPGGGVDMIALRDLAADGFPEAHVGRAARDASGRVRATAVAALLRL